MLDAGTADQSSTRSATDGSRSGRSWQWISPGSKTAHILWIVGIVAIVGDLVTTIYGLQIGLSERNPFVASVLAQYGLAGLVGLKLLVVVWITVIWRVLSRRYAIAAMAGLALPQAVAVVLNVATILSA